MWSSKFLPTMIISSRYTRHSSTTSHSERFPSNPQKFTGALHNPVLSISSLITSTCQYLPRRDNVEKLLECVHGVIDQRQRVAVLPRNTVQHTKLSRSPSLQGQPVKPKTAGWLNYSLVLHTVTNSFPFFSFY